MLLMLAALAVPQDAVAQDKAERRRARASEKELIREVVRGPYVKSNVGTTVVFPVNARSAKPSTGAPNYSGVVFLGLAAGGEFIDQERFSVAFEASFSQGLVQGPRTESLTFANSLTQGDVHMLMGTGVVEASIYPARRLGIGVRAGGGVGVMPLLMDPTQYAGLVIDQLDGVPAPAHEGPLPMVVVGPTIEYYTKLSQFSIGADVDFTYIVGFNPGLFPSGYLKYTFGRRQRSDG